MIIMGRVGGGGDLEQDVPPVPVMMTAVHTARVQSASHVVIGRPGGGVTVQSAGWRYTERGEKGRQAGRTQRTGWQWVADTIRLTQR